MKFNELKLNEKIQRALIDQGYTEASPIQMQTIPLILEGKDVFGCAQTGSGKTCAFVAPIIDQVMNNGRSPFIKSLIITPTRELAIQINDNIIAYGKYANIKSLVIFGGVGEDPQKKALKGGIDILVATPGRLLDFINQRVVDISHITSFVLDEADRMLDMGFIHDVKKIIKIIPQKRQTLMFSATLPDSIKALCNEILNKPSFVSVNPPASTVDTVDQMIYYVDKNNKIKLMIDLLKAKDISSALVFCRTKHGADKINRQLLSVGIKSAAIHGNKSQTARQNALTDFKNGSIRVLVATDIAARGIDIDYLSHVFNYDLPDVPETYVHRIGRTARAGKSGTAIAFCSIDEMAMVKDIEKTCHIKIKEMTNERYPMEIFTKTVKLPPQPRARRDNQSSSNNGSHAKSGLRYKKNYAVNYK